jgi:hypothetical protein
MSLSSRDLRRYGFTVTDPAPDVRLTERTVRSGDGRVQSVSVPEGVDPGFDYNPGLGANVLMRQAYLAQQSE